MSWLNMKNLKVGFCKDFPGYFDKGSQMIFTEDDKQ